MLDRRGTPLPSPSLRSSKLKGTYLVIYGKWPTFLFTLGTVSIGVVSSYLAGLHRMLWPLEAIMIVVRSAPLLAVPST